MGRGNGVGSDFYCVKCGKKGMPIRRKQSKQKQAGHLKKLFCCFCKQDTNHYEVREYDVDFDYKKFLQDVADGVYKGKDVEE